MGVGTSFGMCPPKKRMGQPTRLAITDRSWLISLGRESLRFGHFQKSIADTGNCLDVTGANGIVAELPAQGTKVASERVISNLKVGLP
jgi:hypothetical protein